MTTDDRDLVFGRIRKASGGRPPQTPLPDFDDNLVIRRDTDLRQDLWLTFAERLQAAHGLAFVDATGLSAWLRQQGWMRGYCDAELWPRLSPAFGSDFFVETTFDLARVDDHQFGITRASGAIAETGTIVLKDSCASPRLAALAPWVHIAAFAHADIHPTLPAAVAALGDDPNIVWVTGPSKTGDIESVLVEGVHGPGVQAALLLPSSFLVK